MDFTSSNRPYGDAGEGKQDGGQENEEIDYLAALVKETESLKTAFSNYQKVRRNAFPPAIPLLLLL